MKFDCLIIGSGLSGLRAAIAATQQGLRCAVLSMVYPIRSHSVAAQGGINAALNNVVLEGGELDSWEKHAFDTVKGSDFLADQSAVAVLTKEAIPRVYEMESWGVPFSRLADGRIAQRPFGGAIFPRTCYAEDRTGHNLLHTLFQQSLRYDIQFFNEWHALDIIREKGQFAGVVAMDIKTGRIEPIPARSLILATGGAGRVFASSTNALINSGSGISLAYRAGIPLKDMEFVQFHPTTLYGTNILITEGARGEGAYLFNNKGERFMERYASKAMELAPRDIVARSIITEINEGRGFEDEYVHLDLTHLGAERIMARLPGIHDIALRFAGVDITREPMPVQPGQHYTMGGIDCDATCQTPMEGIFACGECACVSVHGANRLGGNSLLETLVFGKIAGESAAAYIRNKKPADAGSANLEKAAANRKRQIQSKGNGQKDYLHVGAVYDQLRQMMISHVGVYRDQAGMSKALEAVKQARKDFSLVGLSLASQVFDLELITYLELEAMLDLAEIITVGALQRKESRGSHARRDFTERLDEQYLHHTIATKGENGPVFSTKDVDLSLWEPQERKY